MEGRSFVMWRGGCAGCTMLMMWVVGSSIGGG